MDVVPATPANLGKDTSPGRTGESAAQVHPATEPEPAGSCADRFQILALDGGGTKALFTAHVLARLEQDLGVTISDSFDLIAGTSAGGIVALGLGAGLRPNEIVSHHEELIEKVFPASRRRVWRRLRQLRSPIGLKVGRNTWLPPTSTVAPHAARSPR